MFYKTDTMLQQNMVIELRLTE